MNHFVKIIYRIIILSSVLCSINSPVLHSLDKSPSVTPEATESGIRENRMGTLIVKTAPGAKVKIRQIKHEFQFGSAFSQRIYWKKVNSRDRIKYIETFRENFNFAVHGDALKWHAIEPVRGKPNYSEADTILAWCEQNDIPMRGHCIFWDFESKTPEWAKNLDDSAFLNEIERRAKEVTSRYRGKIKEYDLNNEMIHGGYFEKRFGKRITGKMAEWAHEGDPDAILYVNDYNIMTGKSLNKYILHIRELLKMGVPIGGIGIQSHMAGEIDIEKVKAALDSLSQFNLPIKITEFDFDTSDEEIQAVRFEQFFRVCFAHPSVEGIIMWGFWEGDHWRPGAALWRKDWSPKPAAEIYRKLVFDEWQTNVDITADRKGLCNVQAFYGTYIVETGGKDITVELNKKAGTKTVNFVK